MFARNGDKARFNREHKQKIARCKRTSAAKREILKGDHSKPTARVSSLEDLSREELR
jgi:hypothetical protein